MLINRHKKKQKEKKVEAPKVDNPKPKVEPKKPAKKDK